MEEITDKLANITITKGTDAGGKNTNFHGKKYELLLEKFKLDNILYLFGSDPDYQTELEKIIDF